MSEEMKQEARELVLKSGHVTKDGTYYQSSTEKLLELIAQVCEQRSKLSSKLTPSEWLRENGFGDSAVASDVFDNDGDPHALIGLMDEYGQERAEAAELALQTQIENWQKRIYETCKKVYPEVDGGGCDSGDELDFTVAEIEQTFAHLQDALHVARQSAKTIRAERRQDETSSRRHLPEVRRGISARPHRATQIVRALPLATEER